MHAYDYRCRECDHRFTLYYQSYADYDDATPGCPQCDSNELSRLIIGVAIQRPSRDFTNMSPNEMLSVMESGDSRQMGEMFRQVGGDTPELGADFHEATERLLKGDSIEHVEKDLQASDTTTDTGE